MENQSRLLFSLTLARLACLKASERLLLFRTLESSSDFCRLSNEDVSHLIGRKLSEEKFLSIEALKASEKDLLLMQKKSIWVLNQDDTAFPDCLREIHESPFLLYGRGSLSSLSKNACALVGTRTASAEGRATAHAIARGLALLKVSVVSGLAIGIDAWAHKGALSGLGHTIAVLASGVDAPNPLSNLQLASEILKSGGALVSEYPPGEKSLTWHFPERNRIIAGLSRTTLVIEAPEKSGALITAQYALDEGRETVIAKSLLNNPLSKGTIRLFNEGAKAVSSADDIVNDWRENAFL